MVIRSAQEQNQFHSFTESPGRMVDYWHTQSTGREQYLQRLIRRAFGGGYLCPMSLSLSGHAPQPAAVRIGHYKSSLKRQPSSPEQLERQRE